jgi:hypothetical protein
MVASARSIVDYRPDARCPGEGSTSTIGGEYNLEVAVPGQLGSSHNSITRGLLVILEELKKSLLPGVFSTNRGLIGQ